MVNTKQIKDLLDSGQTIYSQALGRIGRVVGTWGNLVKIKFHRGTGMTCFNMGDPVELVRGKSNNWIIRHPEWVWNKVYGYAI